MDVLGFSIGETFFPYDIIVIFVIIVLAIVISIVRKGLIITLLLSFYPAILLFNSFDYKETFFGDTPGEGAILYIIFYILSVFVLRRIIGDHILEIETTWFEGALLGISFGLLIAFSAFMVFFVNHTELLSDLSQKLFNEGYVFFHLSIPLLLIYLATR